MGLTWQAFKDEVNVLLTVDGDSLGLSENYTPALIKLAVQDLQQFIPAYRGGHTTNILPSELTSIGFASAGDLPADDCQIRDAWVLRFMTLTVGSIAPSTDIITISDHGLATSDIVSLRAASGSTLPGGVTAGASYYVLVLDENTFTLHQTEAGSVDDELMVDLTSTGTGTIYLDYDMRRHPVDDVGWDRRYVLTNAQDCLLANSAQMTINPTEASFIIYPRLLDEDDEGYTHLLEINWDGLRTEWENDDETPFNSKCAEAVANYVKSKIKREGDHDESAKRSYWESYVTDRANLHLNAKRRKKV